MNKGLSLAVTIAAMLAIGGGAYWLGGRQSTGPNSTGGPQAPAAAKVASSAPAAVAVDAANVKLASLAKSITAVGSLRSDETVIVRPEVAGRVSEIAFREGQQVAKGATLIRFDQAVQRAEMRQSEANLALAQSRIDRARDLHVKGFISSQAKDEAESNYKVAQAANELAAAKLTKLEIKAPFAGFIGLRMVSVGDYLKEGQEIVNLEAIDVLKVDFRVPEVFLKDIKVGQALQLTLDAVPNKTFDGQVVAINPLLDANGRAVVIRAAIKNTGVALRPGMFARVNLAGSAQQQAMTVPEQALIPIGDDVFVYKIVDNRALRTKIEVGQRKTGFAEITRGLSEGDLVVTAGQPKLRDGAAVTLATLNGKPSVPAAAAATPTPAAAVEVKKS